MMAMLPEDETIMGIPVIRSGAPQGGALVLKLGSFNDYNHTGPTITLPVCVGREDAERITAEIQAVIDWAGLRGEQKALAFLLGWGIPPVKGILGQPELTKEQSDALADAVAASEKRVVTLLRQAAQICAELETDDHQANLD